MVNWGVNAFFWKFTWGSCFIPLTSPLLCILCISLWTHSHCNFNWNIGIQNKQNHLKLLLFFLKFNWEIIVLSNLLVNVWMASLILNPLDKTKNLKNVLFQNWRWEDQDNSVQHRAVSGHDRVLVQSDLRRERPARRRHRKRRRQAGECQRTSFSSAWWEKLLQLKIVLFLSFFGFLVSTRRGLKFLSPI